MSLAKTYQKKVYSHYQMLPIWRPGTPLELGDIVQKKGGAYIRTSRLKDVDNSIEFEVREDLTGDSEEFDDNGSVTITTKLKGNIAIPNTSLGIEDAGALVEFENDNSIYMKMLNVQYKSIVDQIGLGKRILALYKDGQWAKSMAIVTEVAVCDSATIILSKKRGGKIEIKANVEGEIADIDLANAELGLTVGFNRGIGDKIIAQKGVTALFRVASIKDSFFSDASFGPGLTHRSIVTTPASVRDNEELVTFGHLNYEDLFLND